ncbi:GAF and ANTAR domain-containing protein [Microcella humidisoli]|jgi:GAF domain-containing protein|uniref:GAF and ANTAR domain-containing protein n=1 Tax=Microcella humidisoli TaxID=2963406 RepID=A0ABY5FWY5_9MICO|nr:GAF and ANTAR domain-containing protein [Microcella humidisoli]UTT62447.1 GAF and ANTAR domain-containing protein [Microcella humidisoli]
MIEKSRDQRVADAFVAVADTLIADFDIIDLLHTLINECVELLDVDAGGLVLADEQGDLQLVASSSEQAHLVEIMQLNAGAGPCVDAFTKGHAVTVGDIELDGDTWPAFQAAALAQGFHAVFATPMRLRGQVLGALNLFSTAPGGPTEQDAVIAQALADIATIGILQERSIRESHILNEQLQRALESRVLIEQAKGVLAAVHELDMDQAFRALRDYARANRLTLRTVAEQVAERSVEGLLDAVLAASRTPSERVRSTPGS